MNGLSLLIGSVCTFGAGYFFAQHSKVEAPQTLLPSGRAENTPGAPAVTAGAKSSAKPRSKKPKAPRALIEANILPAKPTPAVGSRSRRVGTEAGSSPVDTPKKFNKTAYMREYMRKRRAKLKEKD